MKEVFFFSEADINAGCFFRGGRLMNPMNLKNGLEAACDFPKASDDMYCTPNHMRLELHLI